MLDTTSVAYSPSSTICFFCVILRCSDSWVPQSLGQLLSALPEGTLQRPDGCPRKLLAQPCAALPSAHVRALGLTASCCLRLTALALTLSASKAGPQWVFALSGHHEGESPRGQGAKGLWLHTRAHPRVPCQSGGSCALWTEVALSPVL